MLVGNAVPKKKASFAEKVKMGAFSQEISTPKTDMEKKKKEKGMFFKRIEFYLNIFCLLLINQERNNFAIKIIVWKMF